jgi:hypothetical protein
LSLPKSFHGPIAVISSSYLHILANCLPLLVDDEIPKEMKNILSISYALVFISKNLKISACN